MENQTNQNPIPQAPQPMPGQTMPTPPPVVPVQPVQSPASVPQPAQGGSKKMLYIILAIIVMLLIAAGVYYYLQATRVSSSNVSVYPTPTSAAPTSTSAASSSAEQAVPVENSTGLDSALNQVNGTSTSSVGAGLDQNTQDSTSFSQ